MNNAGPNLTEKEIKKMNKKFSCPSEKRKNTRTHKPTTTLERHTDNGLLRRWTERQLLTWWLKCFYETFVQGSTFGNLLNISAKNPPHRQAANRFLAILFKINFL